jgi:hypothetical protein
MNDTIIKAILKINPTAEVSVSGDDINQITWENGTTPIPITDIQAKMIEVQAEYDALQYQRNRAKEYPSIQEQLDMQYWDSVNGTNTWQDKINEIKTKYPKG